MTWQPVVTSLFRQRKKKAHSSLQEAIDAAARAILADPLIGEPKVGALQGLEYLVAYRLETRKRLIQFLAVGPHENFYRDLQ